jgi:GLPGLI family protein
VCAGCLIFNPSSHNALNKYIFCDEGIRKNMMRLFSLVLILFAGFTSSAQKIMSDGTISYNVSVVSGKNEPGIADAFDGASLTVYMKGTSVRTDFKSILRLQSIFFDGTDGTAVLLRESGKEKYMTHFEKSQWAAYNKKYEGISFSYTNETKNIANYNCKKAIGTLKDGSTIEVYYTPDITPQAPGYDYIFKDLPGLPLEYQVKNGNVVVKYLASSIANTPVGASKFDKPKAGYKMLEFKQ